EVSFDIKGTGEVDAEALNRFHGVHFGDEIETDELPNVEDAEESDSEESGDDSAEGDAPEGASEEAAAEEEKETKMNWREDVLLRVMEASGITDRDAFIVFAADYDSDDNGYLKKGELEDAAKAWNAREEAESEEAPEESDEKACGICETLNPADASECSACKFTFE
ncbi:MAG TPA: hypothetical protein QGI72_01910, partial [Poseidonia sp.]|nr:hypothetical protein [Poseidonia sp.]